MGEFRRGTLAVMAAHLFAGLLFLAPGYIRPDSIATYQYVRSAVFDGDFSFFNEWSMSGLVRGGVTLFSEVTRTGALSNHWWIGTSILTAPFYLAARAVDTFAGATAAPGFLGLYGVVLAWCSVLFAAIAMAVAWRFVRESVGPARAAFVVAAISLGTPLFFYTFRLPLGTHAAGAMCVALMIAALRIDDDRRGGLAVGLAAGLAIATRLQHFVLIPALIYAGVSAKRPRSWWTRAIGGGALPLIAQAIAWWSIYGTPLGPLTGGANLQGTTWMPFQHIALAEALLSSYHGLFSWSPLAVLSVAGWFLGLKRDRRLALTLLLMFAGEWVANGTFDRYFWGGTSFGARRFVDLAVPFAIGLAWLVAEWRGAIVVAVPLVAWSMALMIAASDGALSLARYVSASELFEAARTLRPFPLHLPPPSQTLIAICVVAVVCAIVVAMRRRIVGFATAYSVIVVCAVLVVALRTPAAARRDAVRLHIDMRASSQLGPLYDERTLLGDEIAWARATGHLDRAASTSREVAAIDRLTRAIEQGGTR